MMLLLAGRSWETLVVRIPDLKLSFPADAFSVLIYFVELCFDDVLQTDFSPKKDTSGSAPTDFSMLLRLTLSPTNSSATVKLSACACSFFIVADIPIPDYFCHRLETAIELLEPCLRGGELTRLGLVD